MEYWEALSPCVAKCVNVVTVCWCAPNSNVLLPIFSPTVLSNCGSPKILWILSHQTKFTKYFFQGGVDVLVFGHSKERNWNALFG